MASKKIFLALAALLAFFLLPSVFAVISSQRALDFVTKENYFLYPNESSQVFPSVKVKNAGQYYWLVAVSSGEAPVAYIPVADKKEIFVSDNSFVQRALFKTADVLWFISKFKERLSSQDQWFFSSSNAGFFSNLALVLQNEPFELESIKSELVDSKANAEILSMNSLLVSMSLKSIALSNSMNGIITSEQFFFNDPDSNRLAGLREEFDNAFSLANDLDGEIIEYNAAIVRLKEIISKSVKIDSSKKNQLLSFANAPSQLQQVSGKAVVANSVKQAIDSAFSSSVSRSKDLIDNLSLRFKRNQAAIKLTGPDDDFREKTDNKFASLELAAKTMLSAEYLFSWKNQEKLSDFSENYSQAKGFFEKGDYDLSMTYSAKAKSNAIIVLRDGFKETEPQGIDWSLWIYFGIILIVLIAVIFFLRNRKKFSALVSQQGSSEEVKIYGWEKN